MSWPGPSALGCVLGLGFPPLLAQQPSCPLGMSLWGCKDHQSMAGQCPQDIIPYTGSARAPQHRDIATVCVKLGGTGILEIHKVFRASSQNPAEIWRNAPRTGPALVILQIPATSRGPKQCPWGKTLALACRSSRRTWYLTTVA